MNSPGEPQSLFDGAGLSDAQLRTLYARTAGSVACVEAADAVAASRAEGKTALLHCVQAFSSTPAVAALYAARHLGVRAETALTEIHRLAAGFVRAISFPAAASPSLRDATRAIRVIEAIQRACENGNSQSVEDA